MAHTKRYIETIGEVRLYKRRGTRSIRIRVRDDGVVRVTLPVWASYKSALAFVKQQMEWIKKQKKPQIFIVDRSVIGHAHTVHYLKASANVSSLSTRVISDEIRVYVPSNMQSYTVAGSRQLHQAAIRALKMQSKAHLCEKTFAIAKRHSFTISDVKVKPMQSRWGSCSSSGVITLNIYLMQLPEKYREYVIFHELVHTYIPNHSKAFWSELAHFVPGMETIKKEMKSMPTRIVPRSL